MIRLGYSICLGDAPDRKIAGADGADLTGADQLIESLHRFFQFGLAIVSVGIVEVNVVRL